MVEASTLRSEPFRLFFPLGILLAGAGVVPWLLFARGAIATWPGVPHALTMSQGFFIAVAIGFLGTMLPRKTQKPALSTASLAALGLGVIASAAAQLAGALVLGEVLYLATFALLGFEAARRVRRGAVPPSFVLVPVGAALGAAGAGLLVASALGAPDVALRVGRALVAQGALLGLVLGVTPFLAPVILLGRPAEQPLRTKIYAILAVILAGSFALDELVAPSAGLLVRAAVAGAIVLRAGALKPSTRRGAHRALFRMALLLVPLGLLVAGLVPERRLALLHVTYGGGFAMLVLAVTVHVTLLHGGREKLAETWPAPLVVAAALALAAVAVRACLEGFGAHYVDAMLVAAALWLAAVAAWAAFLAPHLLRRMSTP